MTARPVHELLAERIAFKSVCRSHTDRIIGLVITELRQIPETQQSSVLHMLVMELVHSYKNKNK